MTSLLFALLLSVPRAPAAVVVWPQRPGLDLAGAEIAIGRERKVVPFAPIAERLEGAAAPVLAAEREGLRRVEQAFKDAREAYLLQRYDRMLDGLGKLESTMLPTLSRPPHCGTLWQLEFLLGLASSGKNPVRARPRYALALTLDPDRRPEREVYGPRVAEEFAAVVAERATAVRSPLHLRVTPPDARVLVDCAPASVRPSLAPGLHVVSASLPGLRPVAQLVDTAKTDAVDLVLKPLDPEDAAAHLGAVWMRGDLLAEAAATRTALLAEAQKDGAEGVLFVARDGGWTAQLFSADGTGPLGHGATVAAATSAALGQAVAAAPLPPPADTPRARYPIHKKWWFWTALVVVAGGAVATGVVLGTQSAGPPPDPILNIVSRR